MTDSNRELFSDVSQRARNRMAILHARKERRLNRRISLAEVNRATKVDARTLSKWYKNEIDVYHAAVIAALCAYYECEVSDLIAVGKADEAELGQWAELVTA